VNVYPKGIAQDDSGRLIVCNFGNHRAEVISTNGEFVLMFGIGQDYTRPLTVNESGLIRPREPAPGPGGGGGGGVPPLAGPRNQPEKQAAVVSSAGNYRVSYTAEPAIEVNKPFDLKVTVLDAESKAETPTPVELRVDARMPEHYHGMNTTPRVTRDGPRQHVTGMLFHMPGKWELNFDITRNGATERAKVVIDLE
jgi:hypothetical protein